MRRVTLVPNGHVCCKIKKELGGVRGESSSVIGMSLILVLGSGTDSPVGRKKLPEGSVRLDGLGKLEDPRSFSLKNDVCDLYNLLTYESVYCLAPHLEELFIQDNTYGNDPVNPPVQAFEYGNVAFLNMVSSRRQLRSETTLLKSMTLTAPHSPRPKRLLKAMKKHKRDGMSIRFYGYAWTMSLERTLSLEEYKDEGRSLRNRSRAFRGSDLHHYPERTSSHELPLSVLRAILEAMFGKHLKELFQQCGAEKQQSNVYRGGLIVTEDASRETAEERIVDKTHVRGRIHGCPLHVIVSNIEDITE
ncbi:hypothetical protein ARMSODRAFT_982818 [Armillaria solidipes]|uniref:Uncharacterized protein n=1 Tax=Armillaria solidipes TaxID=1076256 RepID=A0A2H3ASM6_9AGAR|nr:hypothetical protein ARMSODRAFT_982818 [Armillaria solidipes]